MDEPLLDPDPARRRSCLLPCASAVVAIVLVSFLLVTCERRVPRRPFDAETWRAATYESGLRQEMVHELLDGRLAPGTPKADVVVLLGEEHGFRCGAGENVMSYLVGRERALFPTANDEWLFLAFDSRERLVSAELHTH